MCGSNAAGESMPLHVMFSSSASKEKNMLLMPHGLLACTECMLSLDIKKSSEGKESF